MSGTETSSQKRTSLWLDCDPGHDDAFAILLAAHHPNLNLLGISTVHGNASLEHSTINAGSVLGAIGRPDIGVYPGARKPFCREAVHAPYIHGVTGIDGTDLLPEPTSPPITETNAILAIRDTLLAQPKGEAWLVATGALTNVGLLFATFPELAAHIKGLSVMGGSIGDSFSPTTERGSDEPFGNTTFYAEFNVYCDPEAAHSIFSDPTLAAKTTLVPLDLTHQIIATHDVRQRLLNGSSSPAKSAGLTVRQMYHDLLNFYVKTYNEVFGLVDGSPLHDPVAVAVVLFDEGIEELSYDDAGGERFSIVVRTEGEHEQPDFHDRNVHQAQLGRTVVKKLAPGAEGIRVPRGLAAARFWDLLDHCMQRAEETLLNQRGRKRKEAPDS